MNYLTACVLSYSMLLWSVNCYSTVCRQQSQVWLWRVLTCNLDHAAFYFYKGPLFCSCGDLLSLSLKLIVSQRCQERLRIWMRRGTDEGLMRDWRGREKVFGLLRVNTEWKHTQSSPACPDAWETVSQEKKCVLWPMYCILQNTHFNNCNNTDEIKSCTPSPLQATSLQKQIWLSGAIHGDTLCHWWNE